MIRRAVFRAVALGLGGVGPLVTAEAPPEIAGWIEQLAAPQFARREAASRSLLAAGRPAVAALAAAVTRGDLEVASRGVEILRDMLGADDPETAGAAERSLEELAELGTPTARQLAGAVLAFHFADRADQAREQLEAAGAVFEERVLPGGGGEIVYAVELSAGWQGGVDELRLLVRLPHLAWLSVKGIPLDDEAVTVIGRLRGVQRIELFGTGAGAAALTGLAERLPAVDIDVRKGGRLGVSSTGGGPCEVAHVLPGSAAELAGVQVGDVIVRVDGEPILGFAGLTERVSRRGPGEEVVLSIARPTGDDEPERIECRAVLDAW
jgi:hypothetical protein